MLSTTSSTYNELTELSGIKKMMKMFHFFSESVNNARYELKKT